MVKYNFLEKVLLVSEIACFGAIVAKNDPDLTKSIIGIGVIAFNTLIGLAVVG
jgi:hypothetical protein